MGTSQYPTNQSPIGMANNPQLLVTAADAAQEAPSGPIAPTNRPDFQRQEYKDLHPLLEMCRDLMDGTAVIHAKGPMYLPKFPAERQDTYQHRSTTTEVFRAFARTVQAAVGMITATPPALVEDTATPEIQSDWEDIDLQGTHGEVFAKQLCEEGVVSGLMAVLVDFPPVPSDVALHLGDAKALNLRPYWTKIPRDHILSWVIEPPDWEGIVRDFKAGIITTEQAQSFARSHVLRQVVIYEPTDVATGQFGTVTRDRYRVLTLSDDGVAFVVYEKRDGDAGSQQDIFVIVASGEMLGYKNQPLHQIPLALGYAGRKRGPLLADLPLLALAELNIGHYRVSANRRYLLDLCHAPTLVIIGITPDDGSDTGGHPAHRHVSLGPNAQLHLPTGGDAKWIAAQPTALNSSKEEKDDLLTQMGVLGMSFLAKDRRNQQETALGRRLDDAAENATHATAARALQDCLEQAFVFHAQYRGTEPPSCTVKTTFAADQVDAVLAGVLWQAVAGDRIPIEAFLEYVQTGKLPDEIDLDEVNAMRAAKDQMAADAQTAQLATLHAALAGKNGQPGNQQPPAKGKGGKSGKVPPQDGADDNSGDGTDIQPENV